MPRTTGWNRLEVGTILKEDDVWDYARNRNKTRQNHRRTHYDISKERIGTPVCKGESIDWFRFEIVED